MSALASADFEDRLVPRMVPQEPDRAVAAAPAGSSSPVGAAFSHFTQTCGDAPQQATTAPGDVTPASGAVHLSEASRFILSLIAAHEGRSERDTLAWIIAEAGKAIGIPALLSRGAEDIGDIADLPGHARKAANRFRSGGP
ncbi:hypothetical protein FJW07_13990 [Mesorhizobium sp. B3-1-9]|uniref:hypothetical protein n=1 Tax=Mesorhizobium sp. B3-1-9 TaxID=2589892 RepID=UPI00112C9082|nr:hypothetical protein [Mesorhizobium sp. B3-1-9]TPI39287.1 hypothetical protein FJW07_13990 [Mesorhizobium sp. B3-1-9]